MQSHVMPLGKGRQLLSGRSFPWEEEVLLSATSVSTDGRIGPILLMSPDAMVPPGGEDR